ncbi:MAG TPA: tripartite tricarboxylate transporter substrate binding protein [Xanthobacteraceae bacterium]|jgi:tripartite-type tricarboxylate transporter receptor subunit TctC|nr:tripartite tricarboxylate transporter substrate binding protein [Xanthobacteraceae bacterium]
MIARCIAVLFAGALSIAPAAAQSDYPSHPVRIIAGQAPGSTVDIAARLIGQWLSQHLGQQFIVDNRPGAGQNIGTEAALHSPPDGYTLLATTTANTGNASVYRHLNFDFIRDSAAVAGILRVPNVVEVNPGVPAKTIAEFIAYGKANPGKIVLASGGNGTTPHLAGELFMAMTGIKMLHVAYRGTTPALNDLIGGQVQVMFDALPPSIGFIKGGQLRALAVTTTSRSPALPDIPTVSETVPGYDVSSWTGMVAPAGTPPEIVARLNKEINAALADPEIVAKLNNLGSTPMPMTPAAFGKFIVDETAKWAKVVKSAGIQSE